MQDHNMFVKRPSAADTEEDILSMQADWEASKRFTQSSTQIFRLGKSSSEGEPRMKRTRREKLETSSRNFKEGGRFTIDLDKITEEWSNKVLFDVEEQNADWLESDHSDQLTRQRFEKLQYSADDGFPEVLDLSAYYKKNTAEKRSAGGKSFFAAEFDRLHGKIELAVSASDESKPEEDDNFEMENDKFLSSLTKEKINELRAEINEKMDQATISFLKNRYKKRSTAAESRIKVSKFKSSRVGGIGEMSTAAEIQLPERQPEPRPEPQPLLAEQQNPLLHEMLDQLEVLDEFTSRSDNEKYNRLATDAVQLDFTTKCLRSIAPRQQKNAVRLFDSCKTSRNSKNDSILELARAQIDKIKELYLEEMKSGDQIFFQFANGVNPLIDGSWTLVPVRRVLDAVHKRDGELCEDDIEIVRLALLWTLLLHDERPTAFLAFAEPNDVFVRLAEVLLIGREVLADDVIATCYSRIMSGYIEKTAIEGRLCIRMDSRVAGLDAFMPFYEDLLAHFEQYSFGDIKFVKTLLIGSYLNSALGDSLEYRCALWSLKKNIVRQITTSRKDLADIMPVVVRQSSEQAPVFEKQHYLQYTTLLGSYTAYIRDEKITHISPETNIEEAVGILLIWIRLHSKVTRDRNPAMFAIAAHELGHFVKRHSTQEEHMDTQKLEEFDTLVSIIRSSLRGKLDL